MRLITLLLDLLYPPRCAFCRRLLPDGQRGACRDCLARLPRVPEGGRRHDVAHTDLCLAPLYYEGAVRESLLRYKFGGLTAYGRVYADFLAKCIDENVISCDSITWVPLSRKRLRRRGYDQAELLARELASILAIPCERLLVKRIDTPPQSGTKSAGQRRKNAAGVYACPDAGRVRGKRIVLVDDIVTTGATLSECARVLKEAGAAEIIAAAAATRS